MMKIKEMQTMATQMRKLHLFGMLLAAGMTATTAEAKNLAIAGGVIHTMAGQPITNGVVLVKDGRIAAVGHKDTVIIPADFETITAQIVTPGLIDAHTVLGLSGILNISADQEQVEKSGPIQPELRAIDAYNPREELIDHVRALGVTTIHTGHGPGALISGQTMVVKTYPPDMDRAVMVPEAMIAASLGPAASAAGAGKEPGTSAKAIAMLREQFLKALDYNKKSQGKEADKRPARDLRLEALGKVVEGKLPLLVTVDRHQDIIAALRLAAEFKLSLVLDSVADAQLVMAQIKKSGFPVIIHPPMARATAEKENLSLETPAKLREAGVTFAMQSGHEAYVPKTRVVLFEAAIAAANGLKFEEALASITIDAARLLKVDHRVGSIETGKDADLALYDGDPFEYTSHCVGVIVSGEVVSSTPK
jgi:imidazolonepropionase-like amidohydrolase